MTKITIKLFKESLEGSLGTQRDMSQRLNVTDSGMAQYLERNPKMMALLQKKRLDNIDKAEHEIFGQLEFDKYSKEPATAAKIRQNAAQYILSRIGKHRGWVEKQEVAIEGNLSTTSLTKEEFKETIERLHKIKK